MEQKLKALIERIETSSLSEEDKVKLYAVISEGLKASIWPSFLSAMPKDQLEVLSKNPSKATLEAFGKLLEDTVGDGKVLAEVDDVMNGLLEEVDAALREEHI